MMYIFIINIIYKMAKQYVISKILFKVMELRCMTDLKISKPILVRPSDSAELDQYVWHHIIEICEVIGKQAQLSISWRLLIILVFLHWNRDSMRQSTEPQRYRSYQHLLYITMNICLSSFGFGHIVVYFNSISFKDISVIYQIPEADRSAAQGLLTGCIFFAGGLGSYFSSYLLNKYSRKQCFQIVSTFLGFITILLLIPNLTLCFIVRCLQGVCIGVFSSIASIYMRQFSPIQLAGRLCPWIQIATMGGIAFSFSFTFLLSLLLPVQIYWRIVFILPTFISFIQVYNLKYKYPYQTPKWLMLQNRKAEVRQLLAVIYKQQYIEQVYSQLNFIIHKKYDRQSSISYFTQEDLPDIMHHHSSSRKNSKELQHQLIQIKQKQYIQPKPVQLPTNPFAIAIAVLLHTHQQMIGSGLLISYSGQIVRQLFPSVQKLYPIFLNSFALCGTFLVIPVLKKLGRKNTLIYGSFIQGIALLILTVCFSNFDFNNFDSNSSQNKFFICFLMIFIRFVFSFTTGPVVWIYVSQIVQPNILALTTVINWLCIALMSTFFPILKQILGGNCSIIFLVFGVYTCSCCVLFRTLLIQTQGKNEAEIEKEYEQKWIQIRQK